MSWLYLPGQVVDFSGQNSSDGKQSATLKIINTPSKLSKLESRTDYSTMPPYGTMPEHSTGSPGVDVWISSLLASRANHSAAPEKDTGKKTAGICGLIRGALLAKYDQDLSCWRTFQKSFLTDISDEYLVSYPKWGMTVDGELFKARTSVHLTDEKGYSLWQTPVASDWRRLYFTRESLLKHKYKKNRRGGNDSLVTQVMEEYGWYPTLNFMEWLMGYPIGWTELKPLETDKYQQWLNSHGDY